MRARDRVLKAINHQEPDRVPIDLGGTGQTGIHVGTLAKLRKKLGLPEKPVFTHEPFQMLGVVEEDLRQVLGVDLIGLWNPVNFLGFRNENWKSWKMPDGTEVMMGGGFEFDTDTNGVTYVYPQGDRTVAPSVKMPKDGYFFDSIYRNGEIDEDDLDARRDFQHTYGVFDDETARFLEANSHSLYDDTEYGIVGNFGGGGFGDVAVLSGPFEKQPRGIRKVDDWLMAHLLYPNYVKELFEMQTEIALKNLEIYRQAVGERIQVLNISGTDFGTQKGEIISPDLYREFYKPYHKKLNDWVHQNTSWKTFYHCCGSIVKLLDDMVESGVDILNPVQCSAAGMDPVMLKEKYGKKLVFWGGGVDTQHTLPFRTPEEVKEEVTERLQIFSPSGGYVFNTIHNILGATPVENIHAMFEAVREFNGYRA